MGFVDAGWLGNNNTAGSTKPPSDQLASVGLGLHYSSGAVGLTAEWGRIVSGSVLANTLNSTAPKAGDNRFHVNLTARF